MNVPYLAIKKVNKPVEKKLHAAFERVLKSGVLVLGSEVSAFEKEYATFSHMRFAAGVGNGLEAIKLSLLALGIGEGDEVIVPSNTYIATFLAISDVGAMPVPVEPDKETYNLDYRLCEAAITKKTKAIIPVHLYGQACEMDELVKLAKKKKIAIVEDNAQSHGATYRGKITGSFGEINATSFYPGKNLGALGDGGAITTNNEKYYNKVLLLRNYGSKIKYKNEIIGYNSRLDELQAAFLREKLSMLMSGNKERQKIAAAYIDGLKNIEDVVLPVTAKHATHVYHVFVLRTKKRDALRRYLQEQGIQTLIHYPQPPHLQKPYQYLGYKKGDFPIAEELAQTSLSLPIYPGLPMSQVKYTISMIKKFFANSRTA